MKTLSTFLALFLVSISFVVISPVSAVEIKAAPGSAAASEPKMAEQFKGPEELLFAASRGDIAAQLEIAILYEYGFDMPDKEVYALAWYLLAADGSVKAVKHRDQLMGSLSSERVQQAKKISLTLVTASAKMPGAPSPMPAKVASETTAPQSAPPMPEPLEPLPEPIVTPESH